MKISIVTVAFNAEATIAEAVASVVGQRQAGFELEYIIVDGASSDGTLAALEPYRNGITHIISEPDRGLYDAMNKGIATATGDFIGILNADDAYTIGVLAAVAARLKPARKPCTATSITWLGRVGSVVRRWPVANGAALCGVDAAASDVLPSPVHVHQSGVYSLELSSAADYECAVCCTSTESAPPIYPTY